MGVLWWMEASLTLILNSPCIFIMAPRVTPARCMKCPASCHPCPLSLYLSNLFLLPSASLSSYIPPLTATYLGSLGDTNACSCHINVMYCCSQERAVFFFPSSESIMFVVSASRLCFLALGLHLFLTDTLHLCLPSAGEPFAWRERKKENILPGMWAHRPCHVKSNCTRGHIPDTSDDNFTTGFQPPLQHGDRLTFTTRFWLELTWVRTWPRGKKSRMGPELTRQTVIMFDVSLPQAPVHRSTTAWFVYVCGGECVVLMEHRTVSCMCVNAYYATWRQMKWDLVF